MGCGGSKEKVKDNKSEKQSKAEKSVEAKENNKEEEVKSSDNPPLEEREDGEQEAVEQEAVEQEAVEQAEEAAAGTAAPAAEEEEADKDTADAEEAVVQEVTEDGQAKEPQGEEEGEAAVEGEADDRDAPAASPEKEEEEEMPVAVEEAPHPAPPSQEEAAVPAEEEPQQQQQQQQEAEGEEEVFSPPTTTRAPSTPRRAIPEDIKERKNVRVSEARQEGQLKEDLDVAVSTPRVVKRRPPRASRIVIPPTTGTAAATENNKATTVDAATANSLPNDSLPPHLANPSSEAHETPAAAAAGVQEEDPSSPPPEAAVLAADSPAPRATAYPASVQPHALEPEQLHSRSPTPNFSPESVLYSEANPNDANYVDPNDDPRTPRGRDFSQEAEEYRRLHGQLQEAGEVPEWKVLRPQPMQSSGWAVLRQLRVVMQLQNVAAI